MGSTIATRYLQTHPDQSVHLIRSLLCAPCTFK
ncbi:lysophospholipase [Vibrio chagasii]|nr:lysophospholipase [Vibrio chagasii]